MCPIKNNSNTIEHIVHTSCYLGLRLTLCLLMFMVVSHDVSEKSPGTFELIKVRNRARTQPSAIN